MNRNLLIVLLLLFFSYPSAAEPAIPTRVGGSVTVDGVKLTLQGSAGYIFRVTGTNGKGFIPPAEDKDGLNKRGKYIIEISRVMIRRASQKVLNRIVRLLFMYLRMELN